MRTDAEREVRRQQDKRYRDQHRKAGMCLKHAKKAAPWSVYCEDCLEKKRVQSTRRRRKLGMRRREPAQRHFTQDDKLGLRRMKNANEQRYQNKKKAKGICVVCTKQAEPDKRKCKDHLALARMYMQRRRSTARLSALTLRSAVSFATVPQSPNTELSQVGRD